MKHLNTAIKAEKSRLVIGLFTCHDLSTAHSFFFVCRYLSPHLYDFLEALITQQTSPEEAYRKFDAIASKHTEQLRKCTKQVKFQTIQR